MSPAAVAQLLEKARVNGEPVPRLRMTEEQFERWCPEGVRAEWVDGEVIVMPPDNIEHNDLNGFLWGLVNVYANAHDLGRVFGAMVQVRLAGQRARRIPDVLFVSARRGRIIHRTFIDGAPDLIMEIVSPDSGRRDWRDKYLEYEAAGVREYWVIDPAARQAEVYALVRKKYRRIEEKEGRLNSRVLKGFFIRPEWLWQSPLPKVMAVQKELGLRG